MSYITPDKIVYPGECCPALLTDLAHLLPFQVISQGAFQKLEYRLYGETAWTELTITYSEVVIEGFYFISYHGNAIAELTCGVYEFRLTAGETWYFEPIMIEDFDITTTEFSKVDELMTPFKFTEQIIDTTPLIAPCDMILPFMFRTDNVTSGSIVVTMVDSDGAETALSITVSTGVIDGKTYYWHRGECLYPFLTCGKYYLKIVDGANTYYSVPFMPECGLEDIPDGYRVMLDFNRCVMRDELGIIMYEECSPIPEPEPIPVYEDLIITSVITSNWQSFTTDDQYYSQGFIITEEKTIYSVELIFPDPWARYFGNPDFNVRLSIYNSTGGVPTTLVASCIDVIHSSTWQQERSVTFYFNDILPAGNYCVVMTYEDVVLNNAANYIIVHLNNTNPYSGGGLGYKTEAAVNWSLLAGWDLVCSLTFVTYI
jgi:hypothetical protein